MMDVDVEAAAAAANYNGRDRDSSSHGDTSPIASSFSDHPHDDDDHSNTNTNTNNFDESTSNFKEDDDRRRRNQKAANATEKLYASDNRNVYLCQSLVYIVVNIAGVMIALSAFFAATNDEQSSFEHEFQMFATEIIKSADAHAHHAVEAVDSLAIAVTSYSADASAEKKEDDSVAWPNLTLPDFGRRAQGSIELSNDLLAFTPLVQNTKQRLGWEQYAQEHQDWIRQGLDLREEYDWKPGNIPQHIYRVEENDTMTENTVYAPLWQMAPAPADADIVMLDLFSYPWFHTLSQNAKEARKELFSGVVDLAMVLTHVYPHNVSKDLFDDPQSMIVRAVDREFPSKSQPYAETVGFVVSIVRWSALFTEAIPEGKNGILVNVEDGCGHNFTYEVVGNKAVFRGMGDFHDPKFDHMHLEAPFLRFASWEDFCLYTIRIYPTDKLKAEYLTGKPYRTASQILILFFGLTMLFTAYDWIVQRRQKKSESLVQRTTKIVSDLFPENVHQRLLEEAGKQQRFDTSNNKGLMATAVRDQLKNAALNHLGDDRNEMDKSTPIADLFPEATIMFADIVGFTAWSSTREPAQTFVLLEHIFFEFDSIAKKRRIFKVETVGDCYVATCGLPEPRKDHALAMARFAKDCRNRFVTLMRELEEKLGPDTGDLGIRVGLHSGPVTAGVLRGDRARFQLFGDTMNTASRMESNGKKNKIHISEDTANLLRQAGKGHWLVLREDQVNAKGKGLLTTYWLDKVEGPGTSITSSSESDHSVPPMESASMMLSHPPVILESSILGEPSPAFTLPDKTVRLAKWHCDMLTRQLNEIIRRREALHITADSVATMEEVEKIKFEGLILAEVKPAIDIPTMDAATAERIRMNQDTVVGSEVEAQLCNYVQAIAVLYRDNPFHNFEHASHVTMSIGKLLSRITASVGDDEDTSAENNGGNHEFGIASDPLTHFAFLLSSLIHDVDHRGVPNTQLIKEEDAVAATYGNRSVAEQNSLDIAWNLLMDESYQELRRAIYSTQAEFYQFRSLLINMVMATDIMDKDFNMARSERWASAFGPDSANNAEITNNHKGAVLMECIMQASDICHTMQHWQIYRKWNGRFFDECYRAFHMGRSEVNPVDKWYENELGFFDHVVIPLAQRLKDSKALGASNEEYLTYAMQNRQRWVQKGQELVAEMEQEASRKFLAQQGSQEQ